MLSRRQQPCTRPVPVLAPSSPRGGSVMGHRPSSTGQARSLCSVRHPRQQGTKVGGITEGQSRRAWPCTAPPSTPTEPRPAHRYMQPVRLQPECSGTTRRGRRPPALTCLRSPARASAPPSHELPRHGSGHRDGHCRFLPEAEPRHAKRSRRGQEGGQGEGQPQQEDRREGVEGRGSQTKRDGGTGAATKEKREERRA